MKPGTPLQGRRPAFAVALAAASIVAGLVLASSSAIAVSDSTSLAHAFVSRYVGGPLNSNVQSALRTARMSVASIPVGSAPSGVAYDGANDRLFVTNWGSDNVSIISGTTDAVLGSVIVGSQPVGATFDPSNGDVYVVNEGSANVTVINGTTGRVAMTIPVLDTPVGITYDASNRDLYVDQAANVTENTTGALTVISGETNTVVGSVSIGQGLNGGGPAASAYDSTDGELYVAANYLSDYMLLGQSDLLVVNSTTNQIAMNTQIGGYTSMLECATYNPASDEVAVCDAGNDQVVIVDAATDVVLARVPVGQIPEAAAFDPALHAIVVANFEDDNVTLLNATSTTNIGSISVGSWPDAIAYDYANHGLYIANENSDNLTVLGAIIPPPTAEYRVTFIESGLPTGTEWSVTVVNSSEYNSSGGANWSSAGPLITWWEPNGTYRATVVPVWPYEVTRASIPGPFQVNGSPVEVSVVFAYTAPLRFVVSGLPPDILWTLNVTKGASPGVIETGAGPEKDVRLFANVTYAYTVTFEPPYAHWDTNGNGTLPDSGVIVSITIPSEISATSLPPDSRYPLVASVIAVAAGSVAVVLWRRPRTPNAGSGDAQADSHVAGSG